MTLLSVVLLALAAPSLSLSLPSQIHFSNDPIPETTLPVVLWHGLGDTYNSNGMKSVASLINETYPGTFVHSIYLDEDPSKDRNDGFIGHLADQIEFVCAQLRDIPELYSGFDAMGFSQGGQFLRGYVERCNFPPVRNLITWGSQHNGIADLPECNSSDFWCKAAFALLKRNMWSAYVRNNLVQAQYFRDPEDLETYLELSAWLADINNEKEEKNTTYADNLASLEKFVMIKFTEEKTVVPPDSSVSLPYLIIVVDV